ncbi:MAG: type 1 pili tip component [bacterium]|nr:type 1 pili tip component [bacterium]
MKMQHLLTRWQSFARTPEARLSLHTEIGLHDAARLHALADMYTGGDVSAVLADLLHVALDELEEAFPYTHGQRQIGEDEFGDPLYEDIGPTPRFLALTQQHLKALEAAAQQSPPVA